MVLRSSGVPIFMVNTVTGSTGNQNKTITNIIKCSRTVYFSEGNLNLHWQCNFETNVCKIIAMLSV